MQRTVASPSPSDTSSFMSHISSAHEPSQRPHDPPQSHTSLPPSSKHADKAPATREASVQETSASDDEPWYAVRDIIDEKKQGHRLLYLVDWEDNPVTGESYSPTWTPAKDVNADAISFWEEIKRARRSEPAKKPAKKAASKPAKAPLEKKPAKRTKGKKKDPQGSYSSNNSAVVSQESRPLTPPDAPASADADADASVSKIKKRRLSRAIIDDSDDSDGDIEHEAAPAVKRPRIRASHSQSQSQSQSLGQSLSLLSSPPLSRTPSVDGDGRSEGEQPGCDLDNASESGILVAEVVDTVELAPGSRFDPDEYIRLSQFPSQPQSQLQSQPPARGITPCSPLQDIASPHQASARTIPDSQPDSALLLSASDESQNLFVSRLDSSERPGEAQGTLRGGFTQPAQEQEPELAVTQEPGLRESADWASAAGEQDDLQATAEIGNPVASASRSASRSASASGSIVLHFQTQPEPDFSLVSSQILHQTPLPAHTPVLSDPSHIRYSVVPDSTRPARTTNSTSSQGLLPSSAQIVPALHSNEDLLGHSLPHTTPSRSQASQASQESQKLQRFTMDGSKPRKVGPLEQALLDSMGEAPEYQSPSLPGASQGFAPPLTQEEANLASAAALASVTSAPPVTSVMLTASSMAPNNPIVPLMSDPSNLTIDPIVTQNMPDPMFAPSLAIGGGANELLPSQNIAPRDLSLSDPMASGVLELSPEPEDSAPVAEAEQPPRDVDNGHVSGRSDNDEDDRNDSPQAMEEDDNEDEPDDELDLTNPNYTTHEYVVTLPLAANTRQHYLDMIVEKKNEETIRQFSNVFARDIAEVPDPETVARVDELLRKFIDISDLPTFYDSTPNLSEEERMKQAVNTNSKFSFVYEFLERISTLKKTVLILSGRSLVIDYLEAVVKTAGIYFERLGGDNKPPNEKRAQFGTLSVLLGNATELTVDSLPSTGIDIVIGFDHVARTSGLLGHYIKMSNARAGDKGSTSSPSSNSSSNSNRNNRKDSSSSRIRGPRLPKPIILLLVSAFTVEHADLRLELASVDDLERKNALLLCALECVQYLREYVDSNLPTAPHDAAKAFGQMVTNPAIELEWQPQPLPEDVFDIYIQSSGTTQPTFTQAESIGEYPLRSRKRQMDDHSDDAQSKRVRLSVPIVEDQAPISDTVKRALGGPLWASGSGGPMVQISLDQLEVLAAKVTSLQERLQEKETSEAALTERADSLDRLNKSNAKTIRKCQERLLEATRDRGIFQNERDKATAALAATQEKLASRTEALAAMRTQKTELEARLAETNALLAGSAQPDVAEMGTLRTELAAAKATIASLERKVANADQDLDHARHAYQDASNAAADLSTENRDLSARVKELERRAADNLRQIHETHARSEAEAYRTQWSEAMTMLKERQSELEWTREELRVLKNGRRETRQQSVPRSPRLSVISPRTVAGRGGSASGGGSSSAGSGAGHAVAARQSVSRGNSPVPANFEPSVYSSPLSGAGAGDGSGIGIGGSGSGGGGGPPVPGMTYVTPSQGGGRWGHLGHLRE